MSPHRRWIGSSLLLAAVAAAGGGLAFYKQTANVAAAEQAKLAPEPMEAVTVAYAGEREYRRTTTSIGTVLALRSVTLKNELAGTVAKVNLVPGQIVEAGTVLVELDTSVEQAELKALEAQSALARTQLDRLTRLGAVSAVSTEELDRARADHDVALAQIDRVKAIIARKVIKAPFRARVGLSDLHVGQYLEEGSLITSLQGVDDAIHVDFSVAQSVAMGLREGDTIEILNGSETPIPAKIVALDSRVDPNTRTAMIRATLPAGVTAATPGGSVRVRTPVGKPTKAVSIPVSALRKGPAGDHVYVIEEDASGKNRAKQRLVKSGPTVGDEVLIFAGLTPGTRVAASGSFKLREDVLVGIVDSQPSAATPAPDEVSLRNN